MKRDAAGWVIPFMNTFCAENGVPVLVAGFVKDDNAVLAAFDDTGCLFQADTAAVMWGWLQSRVPITTGGTAQ